MKFKIETIRWHGCAYQAVQPWAAPGPALTAASWQGLHTWCTELFGPAGDVRAPVSSRWYWDHGRLLFRRTADVTAFLLRWS